MSKNKNLSWEKEKSIIKQRLEEGQYVRITRAIISAGRGNDEIILSPNFLFIIDYGDQLEIVYPNNISIMIKEGSLEIMQTYG